MEKFYKSTIMQIVDLSSFNVLVSTELDVYYRVLNVVEVILKPVVLVVLVRMTLCIPVSLWNLCI